MPRNLPTPPPERLHLPGSVGKLGATFETPAGDPRAAVLLLHPLSTHGGTRRNNVVRYGAIGALEAGCAALRIDFRGAGDSEGEFDDGRGEVDDAAAAFDWLHARVPAVPVFVWGFSFGALVGLRLAIRQDRDLAGYLAVAWPSGIYEWPAASEWPVEPAGHGRPDWESRMAFLAGDRDEFVDLEQMGPAHERRAQVEVLPGAGHFFPGELEQVRGFTARVLEGWLGAGHAAD